MKEKSKQTMNSLKEINWDLCCTIQAATYEDGPEQNANPSSHKQELTENQTPCTSSFHVKYLVF